MRQVGNRGLTTSGYTVIAVNLDAQLADRERRVQERLRRECSERENHLGPNQLDLANEIRTTRLHFVR